MHSCLAALFGVGFPKGIEHVPAALQIPLVVATIETAVQAAVLLAAPEGFAAVFLVLAYIREHDEGGGYVLSLTGMSEHVR